MDDLISRQAAIDAINEEMGRHGDLDPAGWGLMVARDCIIAKLPSAQPEKTETNIFDTEETYHGCTVQVLSNSVTGETSIGWWRSDGSD